MDSKRVELIRAWYEHHFALAYTHIMELSRLTQLDQTSIASSTVPSHSCLDFDHCLPDSEP